MCDETAAVLHKLRKRSQGVSGVEVGGAVEECSASSRALAFCSTGDGDSPFNLSKIRKINSWNGEPRRDGGYLKPGLFDSDSQESVSRSRVYFKGFVFPSFSPAHFALCISVAGNVIAHAANRGAISLRYRWTAMIEMVGEKRAEASVRTLRRRPRPHRREDPVKPEASQSWKKQQHGERTEENEAKAINVGSFSAS